MEKNEKDQAEEKRITLSEVEYNLLKEDAAKAGEYWQRLLRLQADFDNMRKRIEKEKSEFVKFANEGVLLDLLNVLDDLERAVELAEKGKEDFGAFLKGVEMILAHLYEVLKENGVTAVDAAGKPFDPHLYEALMQQEKDDLAENTVIEELQKGYLINGRVLRTAKVKVSKKKEQ